MARTHLLPIRILTLAIAQPTALILMAPESLPTRGSSGGMVNSQDQEARAP